MRPGLYVVKETALVPGNLTLVLVSLPIFKLLLVFRN